jgi:hypothetical protein
MLQTNIALMMEAINISETTVNFYEIKAQRPRRKSSSGKHCSFRGCITTGQPMITRQTTRLKEERPRVLPITDK